MDELRKVKVLSNDGRSGLIQVEDDNGSFWIRRGRVHLIGTEYFITSERQAQLARGAIARRAKREAMRIAKEKLAAQAEAAEAKNSTAASVAA
jgi:hypothetical protein